KILIFAAALMLPQVSWGNAGGFYYVAQPRDSLDVIARRVKVSIYDIAKANRLSVNARVSPGTRLWIPKPSTTTTNRAPSKVSPKKPTTPTTTKKASPPSSTQGYWVYTV